MTASEEPAADCVVRRWLPHPAARVYAAFLDPEVLPHWYGPDGLHPEPGSAHVEPVEGGAWRIVLVNDHDHLLRVAVERTLTRLVAGRVIETEEPTPSEEATRWRLALVEDPLDAEPRGTTLEVREGPVPPAAAARAATGWSQSLARLERVLGARR